MCDRIGSSSTGRAGSFPLLATFLSQYYIFNFLDPPSNIKMSATDKKLAVEKFETLSEDEAQSKDTARHQTMGTVTMTDSDEVFLVPSPSADPRGKCTKRYPAGMMLTAVRSFEHVAGC